MFYIKKHLIQILIIFVNDVIGNGYITGKYIQIKERKVDIYHPKTLIYRVILNLLDIAHIDIINQSL